jgi:hypothetical protein
MENLLVAVDHNWRLDSLESPRRLMRQRRHLLPRQGPRHEHDRLPPRQ